MFDTGAIKSGFGRAAEAYDEYALLQAKVRETCITLARPHFPSGAHIIDLGAGTGAFAQEAPLWRVTGLDLSYGMCAVAEKHQRVVNADAESLPFADERFDGVFSSLMLQWVNDPAKALSEMARVIPPARKIILSTLVAGTLSELKHAFAAVDQHPHVSGFLETHQLLAYAKEAGCSLVMAKEVAVTEYYPDAVALMRALQAIGATHKDSTRRKGLMTPKQFARMEEAYARLRTERGLPATWQVLYLVLRKA